MSTEPKPESRPERVPRVPEPTVLERMEEAGRAAAGALLGAAIPVGGDALAEFLGGLCPSVKTRREDAWMVKLRSAVNWLLRNALTMRDLDNDQFHDIVCAATEAARRTHLDEKREALHNAIVNAALPGAPSQLKQHMFVRLVDELSELHLHLLHLLDDPAGWFETHGMTLPVHRGGTGIAFDPTTSDAGLESVLRRAFPEYEDDMPLVLLVLRDLKQRGLVQDREQGMPRGMDATTYFAPGKTFETPLGGEFLRFIHAPASPPA